MITTDPVPEQHTLEVQISAQAWQTLRASAARAGASPEALAALWLEEKAAAAGLHDPVQEPRH